MIKSFRDRRTKELYATGAAKRFPPDVAKRAARKLDYVDLATQLDDLKVRPATGFISWKAIVRDSTQSRLMTNGAFVSDS